MGFSAADKVLSPERLPITEPLLPAITRPPDVGSYINAKVSQRRKDQMGAMRASLPQPMGGGMDLAGTLAQSPNTSLLSVLDPAALLGARGEVKGKAPPPGVTRELVGALSGGGGGALVRADVETVSGAIGQGRIPDTRGPLRGPSLSAK